jgi:hypothetical protein
MPPPNKKSKVANARRLQNHTGFTTILSIELDSDYSPSDDEEAWFMPRKQERVYFVFNSHLGCCKDCIIKDSIYVCLLVALDPCI